MTREIKFRVWSESDKEYRADLLSELTPPFITADYNDEGDRFDIEQYTGLKDKNGKEIYEGDIVKFDCGDQTPAEVVYEAGSYFLRAIDDGSLFYDPETDKPCLLGWLETWGLEVIGNIHENLELLEEVK